MLKRPDTDFLRSHLLDVPVFRALIRATECRLLAQLGELPRPVLDVGCGDGHFVQMACAEPLDVGLDPARAALAEAKGRGSYRLLLEGSATALPFADASFQTVLSNCVLEHIPDLEAALAEIARVLRPGGRLVTTVPSPHLDEMLLGGRLLARLGLAGLAARYRRWFQGVSRHYHLYDVDRWMALLAQGGLRLLFHHYYFSAATLTAFEVGHFTSAPSLLTHKVTGRWVLWRHPLSVAPLERLLRPLYEEPEPRAGAYIFLVAQK